MTIDEAVEMYTSNAEYERTHGDLQGCLEFRQLAEWLRDYKRLKEQEPCEDAISRQVVLDTISELNAISFYEAQEDSRETYYEIRQAIKDLSPVKQEPNTGQYEKHIDHTDCIWYGNDSGCPVTCSQYRDGWNDAMDYIFKNGKGYQPYRHDG